MKKRYNVTLAIFVGLALGVVNGLWILPSISGVVPAIDLITSLYMSALKMMIFPLVFCSLIVGIKGIGSASATGKVGGQSLLYFIATTLFASLLGLFLPKALGFGKDVFIDLAAQADAGVEAMPFSGLLDTVKSLIPSNPIASFANGDMLQVLVFALIVGIACLVLGRKADPFVNVCESLNDVCVKIVEWVMYTTPVGVFCSISSVCYSNGVATIASLGKVLLVLYVTYIVYGIVIYGGLVKLIGKVSPLTFFKKIMPAALNAFGTCSSSATLPISKKCADDLNVPNEISSFALPLGATINMDAVSILMSFMIVYFANACGIEVSFGMMVIVLLSNTLLSIGTPGVPGGAIAAFAALATIAGLPVEIMAIYVSVNTLCDMGATCINVLGDLACSVAMSRTCKLEKKDS